MSERVKREGWAPASAAPVSPPGRLIPCSVLIAERSNGSLACHLVAKGQSPRALAERLAGDPRFIAVGLGQIFEVKRGAGND